MEPLLKKEDKKAKRWITVISVILFLAIILMGNDRFTPNMELPFNPYIFASINATINSFVSLFLVLALVFVKKQNYIRHRNMMLLAIGGSALFMISYVMHHLFTDSTSYGGEGIAKTFYYVILFSHILLAGIIMPFILWTAYKGLTGDYKKHAKIARITWPIWFYVSITGVIIYWMIKPYYPI